MLVFLSLFKTTLLICIYLCLFKCVESAVPANLLLPRNGLSKGELIRIYFTEGLKYADIILALYSRHNIKLCLRQLKRILRSLGLQRRPQNYSTTQAVENAIIRECNLSGECVGYRNMWKRLLRDHGIIAKRNDVMTILRRLYPKATEERASHRLKRRAYIVKGPNYAWHVDGYDKLKPFGFCIHGCIDGYSRRVMWLEVASTNNNPAVVAKYFLDCVSYVKCVPRILRSDMGTENSYLSFLQPLFRYSSGDSMAGLKSFIYGKSTTNQKIEAWWCSLRKLGIHWWINFFKDIRDCGLFDINCNLTKELLRFCFMDALQTDLDRIAVQWNSHDIRQMKQYTELPSGKPDVMYFLPELKAGYDFRTKIDSGDTKTCVSLYGRKKEKCRREFEEYILRPDIQVPVHPDAALRLFIELYELLHEFI